MIPQKFKTMMGIKDEQDLKMANNIWKMLDQMSSNDPQAYEKFIEKNLTEGFSDAKAQKQKKQKPYKIKPHQYLLLQMNATLTQQLLSTQQGAEFKQKLDININKQKWEGVKAKFTNKVKIFLNISHTDRIKNPTSKSNGGEGIKNFNVSMLKDIQSLYYSLQGPQIQDKDKTQPKWYFCMIFNTNFLKSFETIPNGVRILLGLAVAYFQQRLKEDRNPVHGKINTKPLYGKNLYYNIQKQSMKINDKQKFHYGKETKMCEFLLEKEIDTKQRENDSQKKQIKKSDTIQTKQTKPKQILIRPKQDHKSLQETSQLPPLLNTQLNPPKKVLIEEINEKDPFMKNDYSIPYEMKQDQHGYSFQFLISGVDKITDLDLQVSSQIMKLKTINKQPERSIKICLKKPIDVDNVRAKMKKKSNILQVKLSFIK